ncbi:hypothetical protein H6S82_08975 [Planktothrix sp. FACHB-1355]|uniref:Uncharacterized protein n=1 Tax=Aerosakkonema funiforme FACHB-1375 TaxID=2949571 RepID=A0A926VJP0_9CYAN|nr:hypothetical protein [Aerosakkonema funiforme]MBD2185025.1 hypothetical protein [Aerosakkonema funiforme FACHB-1375]MBD3558988.1 hypothetical protein [Planktothrix sp. FACHB-1355]
MSSFIDIEKQINPVSHPRSQSSQQSGFCKRSSQNIDIEKQRNPVSHPFKLAIALSVSSSV